MQEGDAADLRDVESVLNGDGDAYARLVERHGPAVAKQMRNFSRDPLTAEELAQDVFVEAYLSLGKFRAEAPFRHWLARIATLVGYKFWKKRDRTRKTTVSLSEAPDPPAPEKPDRDPVAAADLLHELLAMLPAADRLLMTLMYLEKCGQEEIAERTGHTRVMVAVRLHRAKQKLKKIGQKEPWKGRLEWMLS